jgi:hypothetical protein
MTPLNAPPLALTDGQHVTNNSVNDDNSQDESWPAFQDDFFNNPQKQDLIPFSTPPDSAPPLGANPPPITTYTTTDWCVSITLPEPTHHLEYNPHSEVQSLTGGQYE